MAGYEAFYEVSSEGRVRGLQYRPGTYPGRILRPGGSPNGYHGVTLVDVAGGKRRFLVHRLVASTFIRLPRSGEHVNHIDGRKTNNRVANLEWVTPSDNSAHAARLGLSASGERHHRTTLSARDVRAIRKSMLPVRDLAMRYRVTGATIRNIRARKTWQHLAV